MKGTLLGQQSTLSSVSRLITEEISFNFILFTFQACAINTVSLVAVVQ